MSDILLLSMPYGKSYGKIDIESLDFGVPPVGLAYIGSYLKSAGCDVRLVDLMFSTSNWEEVRTLIHKESPKWLGISATTPQINEAFTTAKIAKKLNPDMQVVIGGIHASALPEETLSNENIDILVYGEGEMTMLELVEGKVIDQIEGIYYKRDQKIIKNPPRSLENDLDKFPYPLYEDLPLERYGGEHVGATLGIISSRGCPYQCTYCAANTIHKRKFRKRSIENIVGEIEKFKHLFKVTKFSFYDDTFTLDKNRTVAICEAIMKRDMNLEWNCITRGDSLTKPLLEIMKKAGCSMVQIGIESGSNEILRKAKRRETVEENLQAVHWAKQAGMEVVGLFILGLPYETEETIKQTIEIAKKSKVDYAQFSILVPLPGSEVWDLAQKGEAIELITSNWEDFGRYGRSIIRLKGLDEDALSKYFVKAYKKFYMRPSYIIKKLGKVTNLASFLNLSKKGLVLLKLIK
ncbi:MAG: hypothetical protein A3D13_01460 [Planctomycetes bacterium RIFCSPHIGHO2_02_FULL_40_12]|nr:MAG: hypothetical protein A3D13_01460 [Planctomycetes bacterium RIFCSPHIGHO2_02_FULL_40_12]